MANRTIWMAVVVSGCATGEDPATTGPEGACEATENPLRFACALTVEEGGDAVWTVSEAGEPIRTFTTSGPDHALVMWGLPPDADLTWEVVTPGGTAGGTFRTGSLPQGLRDLTVTTSGEAVDTDAFVVPYDCSGETGLVMPGADGRVRWYQPFAFGDGGGFGPTSGLTAFDWRDDRAVVVTETDRVTLVEATGEVVFDVSGFDLPLHHDAAIQGDHVLLLNADEHDGHVVDGMYVLDATGATVAAWDLADHVAVTGEGSSDVFWTQTFPNATDDWSHGNGVTPDGEDHVLVSLRWQDAVVRVASDPGAEDFGEIDWVLTGQPGTDLPGDFTWPEGGGFVGQHHATRLADGGVGVFDNGRPADGSRGLFLDVDLATMTVTERESWPVGEFCFVTGGAAELPGGGALVTCDTDRTVYEFVPGEAAPVWEATIACETTAAGFGSVVNAHPVFLAK